MTTVRTLTFPSLLSAHGKKLSLSVVCLVFDNLLALALPWVIKIIIDDVIVQKDIRLLNQLIVGLVGILFLRALLSFGKRFMSDMVGENILGDVRKKIYWHAQRLPLIHMNKITPAQILTRISGDVTSIRRFIAGDALEFLHAVLNCAIILIVLCTLNLRLTLVALTALPLFVFFYFRLLPELKLRYKQLRETYGLLTSRISEVLNGIRTVRAFATTNHEQEIFLQRQGEIQKIASRTHGLNAGLWGGIEFFTALGIVAVLGMGGRQVMAGRLTPGELIAFYTYLGMLFAPIIQMVIINSSYQEARAALNRINEVLSLPEVLTPAHPAVVDKIAGSVEFQDVGFEYSAGEAVLKNIRFTAQPGEIVGIVGASGAGKTTLISLLLRFFEPGQGRILVDENDVRDLDLEGYLKQVAIVLQDDFLFSGSVRENISYGSFGASDERIVAAAQSAQAHGFISQLKNGYETAVGERGLNLSCGQRQRLAIARALVKNPAILILDEATSSVDALTENQIQKSVREHLPQATIFVIAHRFSTIMDADKIIVLDKGRIVECGAHADLVSQGGFYSQLYHEQFKKTGPGPLTPAAEKNNSFIRAAQ